MRSKMADVRVLQRRVRELETQIAEQKRGPVDSFISLDETNETTYANTGPAEEQQPSRADTPAQLPEVAIDSRLSSPGPDGGKGGEMQVYGATSLLHDRASGSFWMTTKSIETESDAAMRSAAQDRLISQAAISAQKEAILYSTPSITEHIDFDGLPADMAMHLLDLHWNRLHLTYLLTYRPAIMDSLFTSGSYVNKLLLNAIYLQSSLYSNRDGLRLDPEDPQSTGMAFYNRFKALLAQYIDQPTMPTVVALLLCGACLLPYGKHSAGWVYCGMAYRMMVDLGYHLDIHSTSEQDTKFELSACDAEIRRRVYWGAYATDKFQSLYLGRPPAVQLSDSNISRGYLDSYEEMAVWKPYTDPQAPRTSDQEVYAYQGRPSYAISTFQCLLQLSIIVDQLIGAFYSAKSARTAEITLLQARHEMRSQLDYWNMSLPTHLRFDATKDPTLPPHQVSLQYGIHPCPGDISVFFY